MTNLILCGGNGTRLWPISRTLMPKQFAKIFDNKSLFELTCKRNMQICDNLFIVSNEEQYFIALDQLDDVGVTNYKFLLEPVGRNTAPAIALSCLGLNPDEIVLVTPSDHLIKDTKAYKEAMNKGKIFAKNGYMVVFGIKPTFAHTGFGYIQSEGESVVSFHEKPGIKVATEYIKSEKYYWNSGMFMFKAGVFLDELKKYAPKIYNSCVIAYNNIKSQDVARVRLEDMLNIPDDSIDCAVMEHCKNAKIVFSDIGWSDLGSFDSLCDELEKDENDNTKNANYIAIDSNNNFVYGNSRKIATIDINDCVIIDTNDALLVCKKGSTQKVRQVVTRIKDTELAYTHITTHRPWGTYTILENSEHYKIKRIEVKPGKRLSLQKHFHRNEHWIIVSGTATVTVGNETKILRANESTYIKMGEIHRLANEGKIPVVLIEAQVGEYTGEDDIVRIEDDFNRENK